MRRSINIKNKLHFEPSFELKGKEDTERKYKSEIEKPKKIKKDNNKEQIKYFIEL